jgi:hydroxylysine kinase
LPLTAAEARLFPDLVATRMLTTITVTSARAQRYPDNAPYILRNVATAREGLTSLAAVPRADLLNALEDL